MPDADPLREMERRIDRLAASADLSKAEVRAELYGLRADVQDLRKMLAADYLTRLEFELRFNPVKSLVYGAVSLILVAVLSAVVASVVTQ